MDFSAIPWCHHRFGVKGPWSLHGILWDQVGKSIEHNKAYIIIIIIVVIIIIIYF